MARPTSREELAAYCLRSLGAPVIEINLDEDQIEDRIDEAIQFYQEYHSDSVVRTFVKHKVTQDEINARVIELPDSVISITRVLNITDGASADMFNAKYQFHLNDIYDFQTKGGSTEMLSYAMTKEHIGMIEHILTGNSQQITYSRHKNTLEILTDWSEYIKEDEYIIIECYQTINPEQYTEVYNDMALKKYLTSLLKKNWGANLIKFEGMQLPGGVTINGRPIYDDAVAELEKMEEEWDNKYQLPIDFFCG